MAKTHTETIVVHYDEVTLLVEFEIYEEPERRTTILNVTPIGLIYEAIDSAIKKRLEILFEHTPIVGGMCEECEKSSVYKPKIKLKDKTDICILHKHPIDLPCVKNNEPCPDYV
jgi:hypothetical protein